MTGPVTSILRLESGDFEKMSVEVPLIEACSGGILDTIL